MKKFLMILFNHIYYLFKKMTCVEESKCPCSYGGKTYKEGESLSLGCNKWLISIYSSIKIFK